MTKRDPNFDKHKNIIECREILENNLQCSIPGCNNQLTMFEGPGSKTLCREHQLKDIEYGGMGRSDRLYTYHKEWVCEECGYDAQTDPLFLAIEDEATRDTAMRSYMHGDHLKRRADGGNDSKENIRTLCIKCHIIKTSVQKDWRKPTK